MRGNLNNIETISVHSLKECLENEKPLVLDNRAEGEFKKGFVKGSILAPTPDIRHRHEEWDINQPVFVMCNTSNRSMTAASLLKQKGFKRVINVVGGTSSWAAAGFPMAKEGDN